MPRVDLIIFGGGIAGLWTLSEASRRGYRCLLLEAFTLGSGQTIASQGIIHGGLKYTLQGMMTGSARRIREMPLIWRKSLAGEQAPDLSQTTVRSPHCFLWRTESLSSRLGMFGAKMGLRVVPHNLTREEAPALLANCPGSIGVMEEQVISPFSLITNFADSFRNQIFKFDPSHMHFELDPHRNIKSVQIRSTSGTPLTIETSAVLLTAGRGNESLRTQARRLTRVSEAHCMQTRPLHMVMVRGDLPAFSGHCVDGAKTRVTITSDTDSAGRTVWQLGGQVAEVGVTMTPAELIPHAARELAACVPGMDLSQLEWSTYKVDRAEGITKTGLRPETPQILTEGNLLTAWPAKLALAPQLAEEVCEQLQTLNISPTSADNGSWSDDFATLATPEVALPPWETAENWRTLSEIQTQDEAA